MFLGKKSVILLIALLFYGVFAGIVSAGSLYDEDQYVSLTSDRRSTRVGEIVTVLIYESASASTKMQTDTNKSVDVGARATDGTNTIQGAVGVNSDFGGGGTSGQKGELVASVSVEVLEVMANGDLRVAGEQYIEFNNDVQKISVKGLVRKQDISANNTVLSTRLANASISFSGEGLLTNRSKPGILTTVWNWLF